jgi:hypothetical protein
MMRYDFFFSACLLHCWMQRSEKSGLKTANLEMYSLDSWLPLR